MRDSVTIAAVGAFSLALEGVAEEVRQGRFPPAEHTYSARR